MRIALLVGLLTLIAAPTANARELTSKRAERKATEIMSYMIPLYGQPTPQFTVKSCRVRTARSAPCRVMIRRGDTKCHVRFTVTTYHGLLGFRYGDDIWTSPCSVDGPVGIVG